MVPVDPTAVSLINPKQPGQYLGQGKYLLSHSWQYPPNKVGGALSYGGSVNIPDATGGILFNLLFMAQHISYF